MLHARLIIAGRRQCQRPACTNLEDGQVTKADRNLIFSCQEVQARVVWQRHDCWHHVHRGCCEAVPVAQLWDQRQAGLAHKLRSISGVANDNGSPPRQYGRGQGVGRRRERRRQRRGRCRQSQQRTIRTAAPVSCGIMRACEPGTQVHAKPNMSICSCSARGASHTHTEDHHRGWTALPPAPPRSSCLQRLPWH
jgi:hypothetical protein